MANADSRDKKPGEDLAKPEQTVVKVAPYPIDCTLAKPEAAAAALAASGPSAPVIPPTPGQQKPVVQGRIVRLEDFGFMMKTLATYFKLGDIYQVEFEVPVLKYKINELARVVKTTESTEAYVTDSQREKVVTLELHFKAPQFENVKVIRQFLTKIGQKKAATK